MEINSETKLYHGCATRCRNGTRIPIKNGHLCDHSTSDPFWKKVDSHKPETGSLVVISDIIDEYDVEFLDEQRRRKMKPKGTSRSQVAMKVFSRQQFLFTRNCWL